MARRKRSDEHLASSVAGRDQPAENQRARGARQSVNAQGAPRACCPPKTGRPMTSKNRRSKPPPRRAVVAAGALGAGAAWARFLPGARASDAPETPELKFGMI